MTDLFFRSNISFEELDAVYSFQNLAAVHSNQNITADNGSDNRVDSTINTSNSSGYNEMSSVFLELSKCLSATLCPALLLAALTANPLCVLVFVCSRTFRARTARNARLYYLTLAAGDIVSVLSIPLPWFLGDGLYSLSGGRLHWYEAMRMR